MSKEIEKKEEDNIKITESSINYIITQNQIITVPKISKTDIKNGGKFAQWIDAHTSRQINILDKDYWKSSELMRALIEEDEVKNNKWLFIIIWIILFISILVWIAFIWNSWDIKKVDVKKENEYIKNVSDPLKEEIKKIEIKEDIPKVNIEKVENNNIWDFRSEFELEKLQIQYWQLIEENNNLLVDNNILIEENKILKEKVENYENKAKNITSEAFLLHLGQMVYNKCETAEDEGIKNNCKDLYFNYVKND